MRRILAVLLLFVVGGLVACTLREPVKEAYPVRASGLPGVSPLVVPTVEIAGSAALTYTAAVTESVAAPAAPELTQVRVRGADGLITCLPEGEFVRCHDSFLDLEYTYPAFMGQITGAETRPGGYGGLGYSYAFDGHNFGTVGGRSRDFSEGRDRMFSDQGGSCNLPAEHMCHSWKADLCETVKPGVVLMGAFPRARSFCVTHYNFGVSPVLVVAVDLPMHPVIHGMGFAAYLLPPGAEVDYNPTAQDCSLEAQAHYDRQMDEMRQGIQAGTAELGIQSRYDAMLRLAESITGPYVEDCSSLQATPAAGSDQALPDTGSDQGEAFVCPVTPPNGSTPPYEEPLPLFHGDGQLWTFLWPEGTITVGPDRIEDEGQLFVRLVWWRKAGEAMSISGRRLDSPAPPLEVEILDRDREGSYQRSNLFFPSAGCWEVTGRLGEHELTFVTRVVQVALP